MGNRLDMFIIIRPKMICGRRFPYGQDMASDDHSLRESAFAKIVVFISELQEMTNVDGERIWHVIENGLWKTDGWKAQHDFCHKIAAALFDVPDQVAETFISTYFTYFGKEWGRVDKWRIEKYLVLVRYFLEELHKWARETKKDEKYLVTVYNDVLTMENGSGLQLQFVDVVTPMVMELTRNRPEVADFVKPFSSVFCHPSTRLTLVRRINDIIITPMIESEGEAFFGCDIAASLKFFRGLVSFLGKSVKTKGGNEAILNMRLEARAKSREVIADILKAQEAGGAPAEKEA